MDALKASLNSICRLCLSKVDDPSTMQSLEDENADTVWTASVRSFTLKKPMNSEILPNKMCSYCAVWITKLIHFKLQCQVSERLLTSLLKYYKKEIEKTTAKVTVGGHQWEVPVQDVSQLLSNYDSHLFRLHKAVQCTVSHLDKRAGDGEPVLPYRTVNTIQFYLTFIRHLLLSVNSVASENDEGMFSVHLPGTGRQQPWDNNCLPAWAHDILNQSCGQLWDRFILATCTPSRQTNHHVAPSNQQEMSNNSVEQGDPSKYPVLLSVLSHAGQEQRHQYPQNLAPSSETLQMPPVIHLEDDTPPKNLNVSKSDQMKQTDLSATLTSQPQKVIQSASKQDGENNNPQKSETTEIQPANVLSEQKSQQQPSRASEDLVQQSKATSEAQNTNLSQDVQDKLPKSQSDTPHSKSAESSLATNVTAHSSQISSEAHELLSPSLVQENLNDQIMVENTQELHKSVQPLAGSKSLESQAAEQSASLGRASSTELAKKACESEAEKGVQGSQHAAPAKSQEVTSKLESILGQLQKQAEKTAESQKTANEKESPELRNKNSEKEESQGLLNKETLGSEEANKVQEQTKKTSSEEPTSQATNLHIQSNEVQESRGKMNKTSESQTSEMQQTGTKQLTELQTSSNEAAEANKSVQKQTPAAAAAASSDQEAAANTQAGKESSTTSVEDSRLQTTVKKKFFDLILKKAISRAYEREKTAPAVLKRRNRVHSAEEPISFGLQKHAEMRIKSEPTDSNEDKQTRPSSAPNAGVFDVLPPLIPIPKSNSPNIALNLPFMNKLKERRTNNGNSKEIPSSVDKPVNNAIENEHTYAENTVPPPPPPSSYAIENEHTYAENTVPPPPSSYAIENEHTYAENTAPPPPSSYATENEHTYAENTAPPPSPPSSSVQSSRQPNTTDTTNLSESSTTEKDLGLSKKIAENSVVKISSSVTLHPIKSNEENKKSSVESNAAKDPVVPHRGVIRVRQDLATDPATRIPNQNSKQQQPSNSFAALQSQQHNRVNASSLVQTFPLSGDLQFTGSQKESGVAASQQHVSQLRVPVSGASQQTGLPFPQHNFIGSVIPGSVPNQQQVHHLMSASTSQPHWIVRPPLHYQHSIAGTVPRNQTSVTNVSQALPVGVITTRFQPPPPYSQPIPTSQACQSAVNLLPNNIPVSTSFLGNGTVAMSRLYQKHLGINVPESEHFKEPWISQLVCHLQSLQNGSHYLQTRAQLHGVLQQKNIAPAGIDPKISGMAEQQNNTCTPRSSEPHRVNVPVSQQNMQYNVTLRVSEPGQQNQAAINVPLYSLSSMNRMAALQQQQQQQQQQAVRSRLMNVPVSSQQQLNPLSQPVQRFQHNPQTLRTPAVSQQLTVPQINVVYSQQQSVITSVVKNPVLPQNNVQVSQQNKVQAETNSNNKANNNNNNNPLSQQTLKTGNNVSNLQHQKVPAGPGTSASQQCWSTISVPQHPQGIRMYSYQHKMPPRMIAPTTQNQNMEACSSTSISQNIARTNSSVSVPEYQKQTKLATTVSQKTMQSTNNELQHSKQILGSLLVGQIVHSGPSPPGVCTQKIQSVSQQEAQARNNTSAIRPTNGTAAVTQVTNSAQQQTHTTAVSKPMMLPNQCSSVTSSKSSAQSQLQALRECVSAAGTPRMIAPNICRPGTVTFNQVTGAHSSVSSQPNKQQFLNVNAQCNRTVLGSKQQTLSIADQLQRSAPSTSVKSSGHLVTDMQRLPNVCGGTGQNSVIHSSCSKKDQPGISVLPDVVRAIGPELGVFMEEDAVESSFYKVNSWMSSTEQPVVQAKQKSKPPRKRISKATTALAQSVKWNMISLMRENSRDALGVSEERWEKLQAAIVDPKIFRNTNWRVIKPPGVKVRRYFNRKKQEENKVPTPSVAEPVPNEGAQVGDVLQENARVGDVLEAQMMALFGESSENIDEAGSTEKPSDFRIKITKNNGKYESSHVDRKTTKQRYIFSDSENSDSSDSWELYVPRAAKRRRVIYDDEDEDDEHQNDEHDADELHDDKEDDKPSIKVWQLQSYQLAPYVSVTKLQPEFFKPGCVYDLKDLNVAAMAQRLSMVVRKPGTVGRTLKQELH